MKKADAQMQDRIRAFGCIVCRRFHRVRSDGDIHHCISGGRRIGEDTVICLCPTHHRSGLNKPEFVSRHPWRAEFKKRYGDDMDLFRMTRQLIEAYQ